MDKIRPVDHIVHDIFQTKPARTYHHHMEGDMLNARPLDLQDFTEQIVYFFNGLVVRGLVINHLRIMQIFQVSAVPDNWLERISAARLGLFVALDFDPPTGIPKETLFPPFGSQPLFLDNGIILKMFISVDRLAQAHFDSTRLVTFTLETFIGNQFYPGSLRENQHHWTFRSQAVVFRPALAALLHHRVGGDLGYTFGQIANYLAIFCGERLINYHGSARLR